MRILLTGSRDWSDAAVIEREMTNATSGIDPSQCVLIHGACPTGADPIADKIAEQLGWQVERHPADWKRYGRSAGPIRNQEMVSSGADICLAFIGSNSRGAVGCAMLAELAGIPTRRIVP